jgi:geranylgeranyl diphosphate synthase type I
MNLEAPRVALADALAARRQQVYDCLQATVNRTSLQSLHLGDAVASYVQQPGKALRASIVLFSCGATGGEEVRAVPAAAAIELFHVWTLVHDDVIDRDDLRRGKPTVHADFAGRAQQDLGVTGDAAAHYGMTQALLAGDIQQGWSAALLTESATKHGVNADLVLHLIAELFGSVEAQLVDGEALDVQFSLQDLEATTDAQILDMMQKKTGALYAFAAAAGACIGLDAWLPGDPVVVALTSFARNCGAAFQLQDDVLGIVGNSAATGKPVGSDIREGKRTLIVWSALRNATQPQRNEILAALGNRSASNAQVSQATQLLQTLGGVDYARSLAQTYIADAHAQLATVPQSCYRDLLLALADFVLERDA